MKVMGYWGILWCLVASVSGPLSHADQVVMLDLNDSAAEIQSLLSVTSTTGERTIIFPSDRPTDARRRFLSQQDDYLKQKLQHNKNASASLRAEWQTQQTAYATELEKLRAKIRVGADSLTDRNDPQSLVSMLSGLSHTEGPITLIISGHFYTQDHAGGHLGQLLFQPLLKVLNATIGPRVRNLLLWGCYGLNQQKLDGIWRVAFPNLDLSFGFVDTAPLNSTLASRTLLGRVLQLREELATAGPLEARDRVKKLDSASSTFWSMWNRRGYVQTSLAKATSIPVDVQCVDEVDLKEPIEYWRGYEEGTLQNIDLPPEDFSHPLRRLYRALQAARFPCHFDGVRRSQALLHGVFALLYFDSVKVIASRAWGSSLDLFINNALAVGLVEARELKRLPYLGRHEAVPLIKRLWKSLVAKIDALQEQKILAAYDALPFYSKWSAPSPREANASSIRVRQRGQLEVLRLGWIAINATLVGQTEACVPVAWLGGKDAPSPCPLN